MVHIRQLYQPEPGLLNLFFYTGRCSYTPVVSATLWLLYSFVVLKFNNFIVQRNEIITSVQEYSSHNVADTFMVVLHILFTYIARSQEQ